MDESQFRTPARNSMLKPHSGGNKLNTLAHQTLNIPLPRGQETLRDGNSSDPVEV
jgi:hypothetical protein